MGGEAPKDGARHPLVAWELCVDEQRVLKAWKHAQADHLLKPTGHDAIDEHYGV